MDEIESEEPPRLTSELLAGLRWRTSDLPGFLIAEIPEDFIFDDIFAETRKINSLLSEFDSIPALRVEPDYSSFRPGRNSERALASAFNGDVNGFLRDLRHWNQCTRVHGEIDGLSHVRGIEVPGPRIQDASDRTPRPP